MPPGKDALIIARILCFPPNPTFRALQLCSQSQSNYISERDLLRQDLAKVKFRQAGVADTLDTLRESIQMLTQQIRTAEHDLHRVGHGCGPHSLFKKVGVWHTYVPQLPTCYLRFGWYVISPPLWSSHPHYASSQGIHSHLQNTRYVCFQAAICTAIFNVVKCWYVGIYCLLLQFARS